VARAIEDTYGVGDHGGKDCDNTVSNEEQSEKIARGLTWSAGIVGVELSR
jgi:hypothetical protein